MDFEKIDGLVKENLCRNLTIFFIFLSLIILSLFLGAYYNPNHYANEEIQLRNEFHSKVHYESGVYKKFNQI